MLRVQMDPIDNFISNISHFTVNLIESIINFSS